jgi:hypothetical protein
VIEGETIEKIKEKFKEKTDLLLKEWVLRCLILTYPYRERDVDPKHVPGPTGYVFPGGGLSTYQGYLTPPNPWPTYVPGYQSPFTSIPPLQVTGTTYAPFWGY